MKLIKIINIGLAVLAIALLINIVQPASTITGQLSYHLTLSKPSCNFYNNNLSSEIPIDRCCYEIQKQRICTKEKDTDVKCYTSENSQRYHLLNQKAFLYCKNQGYDVKKQ